MIRTVLRVGLLFCLLFSAYRAHAAFNDVSSDHPYVEAIVYVQSHDIIHGYPDGGFRPSDSINRAEFVKIVVGAFGQEYTCTDTERTAMRYTDIHAEQWFAPYVCSATQAGWVQGNPDGTFRPDTPVNFAEAAKILAGFGGFRGLNWQDKELEWYEPYWYYLSETGIAPQAVQIPARSLLRGEVAHMIARLHRPTGEVPLHDLDEDGVTAWSNQHGCGAVEDADGNSYATVAVGQYCFMAENLNTGEVRPAQTRNGQVDKFCPDFEHGGCAAWGGFYTWDEATNYGDQGDICPDGWHIPTVKEWGAFLENVVDTWSTNGITYLVLQDDDGKVHIMSVPLTGDYHITAGHRNPGFNTNFRVADEFFDEVWLSDFYSVFLQKWQGGQAVDRFFSYASLANEHPSIDVFATRPEPGTISSQLATDFNITFSDFRKDFGASVRCMRDDAADN